MHRYAKLFWGLVSTGFIILFFVTQNDPFFGDAISTISRASNHIYDSDFTQIAYPDNLDPGHPLTFSILHAGLWKIFGKDLWVSHLFNLVIGFLILILFVRWGKKLGYGHKTYLGAGLLALTPLFMSQVVNPNLHLPLTLFALGLLYSLQFGKKWQQVVFASALLLTHLQGLYYLTPIWLWWFFKTQSISIPQRFKLATQVLLIPFLLFIAWLMYHQSITGWYLSSPDYAGHRGFPGIKRFIVNLLMADWRIVDYGQVGLWLIPVLAIFRKRIAWKWDHPFTLFMVLFLFNALAIGFTTKTGPMHRYLLPCIPFLIMGNISWLSHFKPRTIGIVFALLVSGHFWFYPGKIMGDATLSYRSVFPLLEEAKEDFSNSTFYSYAPLGNPGRHTKLNDEREDYKLLYDQDITNAPLALFSNISGDFSAQDMKRLQQWPSKTYQRGYVYVQIFSNPSMVSNPIKGPKRQPSAFEQWFIQLKNTIKGTDGV